MQTPNARQNLCAFRLRLFFQNPHVRIQSTPLFSDSLPNSDWYTSGSELVSLSKLSGSVSSHVTLSRIDALEMDPPTSRHHVGLKVLNGILVSFLRNCRALRVLCCWWILSLSSWALRLGNCKFRLFVKVILVYHQLDAESRDHKAKLPKSVGGGGKPL